MPLQSLFIKETKSFAKAFDKQVGRKERDKLHQHLAENPTVGVLLKGGLRKLRWAKAGGGKRGGVRIIYYYWREDKPLYLLNLFAKNEKDNISAEELKELGILAQHLKKNGD
jgi:hypothetical protein